MSIVTTVTLCCPDCGSSELEELSKVTTYATVTITRDDDGTVRTKSEVRSEVDWDSAKTYAAQCARGCGWKSFAADYHAELVPDADEDEDEDEAPSPGDRVRWAARDADTPTGIVVIPTEAELAEPHNDGSVYVVWPNRSRWEAPASLTVIARVEQEG